MDVELVRAADEVADRGMKVMAARLVEACAARGWSKKQLHEKSGIASSTLARIWDGENTRTRTMLFLFAIVDSEVMVDGVSMPKISDS